MTVALQAVCEYFLWRNHEGLTKGFLVPGRKRRVDVIGHLLLFASRETKGSTHNFTKHEEVHRYDFLVKLRNVGRHMQPFPVFVGWIAPMKPRNIPDIMQLSQGRDFYRENLLPVITFLENE